MRSRRVMSLAFVATVIVVALVAAAGQDQKPGTTTAAAREKLDATTNSRRPAGPAGYLDELHQHAVRGS